MLVQLVGSAQDAGKVGCREALDSWLVRKQYMYWVICAETELSDCRKHTSRREEHTLVFLGIVSII